MIAYIILTRIVSSPAVEHGGPLGQNLLSSAWVEDVWSQIELCSSSSSSQARKTRFIVTDLLDTVMMMFLISVNKMTLLRSWMVLLMTMTLTDEIKQVSGIDWCIWWQWARWPWRWKAGLSEWSGIPVKIRTTKNVKELTHLQDMTLWMTGQHIPQEG